MKNIIVLIALFVGLANFATATSMAQPQPFPGNSTVSKIEIFNINHSWLKTANVGFVTVNKDQWKIILDLNTLPKCGINEFCIPNNPEVIALPIVDTFTDSCGATHYIAEKDETSFDGLLEQIEVVDYMTMLCEIFIPHPTETTYSSFNPRTQKTTESTFHGVKLERIMSIDLPEPMPPVPQFK